MDRATQIKVLASEVRLSIMRLLAKPQRHIGNQ
jgi:hypothetical protein